MNNNIITEFERLISFIQFQINECKKTKDSKECIAHQFRLKQVSQALSTIKKHPSQITLENLEEFKQPGIGKGTLDRIKEILKNGKLEELKNFKDVSDKDKKILEELESIVGVGKVVAKDLFDMGITSVKDLKNKIKSGEIEVNDKIKLGVKYYGKFQGDIPRKEITHIYDIIKSIINKMNKKQDENNKYIFEICGSYRREKPTSGDIDVLVSKLNITSDTNDNINHLEIFVNKLKENIEMNENQPLLVDDITDKNPETKYMGFAQYKDNPVRRIDIRFIPYDSYYSALLYFTGSAELNKKMRIIAKKEGYKLSEYGLIKKDGTKVNVSSEHDIFEALKIEYLIPRLR
jgi:hypothetical protein